MQVLNDPGPWWAGTEGQPLTIVDLIANGGYAPRAAAQPGWVVRICYTRP